MGWNGKVEAAKKAFEEFLAANPSKQRVFAFAEESRKQGKAKKKGDAIPLATLKKVVLMDPDIQRVSKETLMLINHCASLFVSSLVQRTSAEQMAPSKTKTMSEKHLIDAVHSDNKYLFMRHSFKKDSGGGGPSPKAKAAKTRSPPKKKSKLNNAQNTNTNSITNFFGQKK